MPDLKKKIKLALYSKTTIMFIPHSQKAVFSWHIPHWFLYVFSSLFVLLGISSIILTPAINTKIEQYKYFKQSNADFEKKITEVNKFLPNITASQSGLSSTLSNLFQSMGLSKDRIQKDSVLNEGNDSPLIQDNSTFFLNYLQNNISHIGSYIAYFKNFFRSIPAVLPTHSHFYISSPFGWRIHPIFKKKFFHFGVDLALLPGTPVLAAADGVIEVAGWRGGYGIAVYLQHSEGYETRYGHMLRLASGIVAGMHIHRGQTLGYVGASGVATGYHLHYEIRMNDDAMDPTRFFYLDKFRS